MIYHLGFPVKVVNIVHPRQTKKINGYQRTLDATVTIEMSSGDTREVKESDLYENFDGELDRIIKELQVQEA